MAIEAMYPGKRLIHVFRQRPISSCEAGAAMAGTVGMPGPAALHPVILPTSGPDRTIVGFDAPALHSQQMLRWVQGFHWWGPTFLREKVPRNWHVYCDQVTDNFRVIDPADFRVLV